MANFGIGYMGSKNSIAPDILAQLPSGERFIDLFGGGFAMSHCALLSKKYKQVVYSDFDSKLVELIRDAINGKYSYKNFRPVWVSREEFKAKKESDPYIAYVWSFGNGAKAYLYGKDIESDKREMFNFVVWGIITPKLLSLMPDITKFVKSKDIHSRRLEMYRYVKMKLKYSDLNDKQALERFERLQALQSLERFERLQALQSLESFERFERLQVLCRSYEDYEYQHGDVVYCDPPYEDTAEYREGAFDSKKFYDWVASRPYKVYFSSYKISDKRFKLVWAKGKASRLASGNRKETKRGYNFECLYTNKW